MKNCLICTLGNRDIQFKKEYESDLKILENILYKDNDLDSNELCIKKNNFLDNTDKIRKNYNQIEDYITLPILQPCLDKYKKIKKIILIPTDQRNENIKENHKKGDTFIAAKIIKRFLERKGYSNNIEIKAAEFDASNLEKWFNHICKIINNNYEEFDKLIFEISGGIPTSKEAIRLASLFKNKIEVVEIVSGKVNPTNMGFFESRIIKEKVKDLIRNYNYTGALAFEGYYKDDKEVLNLINHLNYRLNFDFENALECYCEKRLEELMNEENTIKKLEYFILELLDNMEIELKNGNYANFLARVYRLDEAMGQYLFLRWFEKTGTKISYKLGNNPPSGLIIVANIGVDNLNEKLESYLNDLMKRIKHNNFKINHKGVSELIKFIEENYINKENGRSYIKLNIPTYYKLINHLYGDSSSEYNVYMKIHKMYKGDHNLRHTTIVAHGFKGINKERINRYLKRNSFMPFAPTILYEYMEDYLINPKYNPFMTALFDVNKNNIERIRGVVHVDNTTRAQILKREFNSLYYDIINYLYDSIDLPVVLNTSFNIHGEPIVCNELDGVRSFKFIGDVLLLGNWLIEKI